MRSYLRYWCDAFRLPDWDRDRVVSGVHDAVKADRWLEIVDIYAAKNAPRRRPRQPGGRWSRMTIAYPASLSVMVG